MTAAESARHTSFGQSGGLTPVDRFGVWLSLRQIRRTVGDVRGKDVADFGCGYDARTMRLLLPQVASATLVDLAIAPDLVADPRVRAIQGPLPDVLGPLPSASLDVILCMSVVEHLWEPDVTLAEFHRLLRPGGVCAINVPSWLGKRALEFSAFRLGWSPFEEMDDHKTYYDPRDLWPMVVRAGFRPHAVRCFRHKFGLNTFAVCRVADEGDTGARTAENDR